MLNVDKTLPKDPDELRQFTALLLAEVRSQVVLIEKLRHQLAGHRHHRFGSSSESIEQLQLALEASEIAVAKMTAKLRLPDEEPKDRPKRRPIPDHIPRMEVELTTGDDDCAQCGGRLRRLGEDVTEELEYVPGRFIVNRIVRPRFACSGCESFTQAALPSTARQAICKANLPRGAPHRTRASRSRPSRPCIGQQIRRSPATLPPKRHLRP
jgi:transposase